MRTFVAVDLTVTPEEAAAALEEERDAEPTPHATKCLARKVEVRESEVWVYRRGSSRSPEKLAREGNGMRQVDALFREPDGGEALLAAGRYSET